MKISPLNEKLSKFEAGNPLMTLGVCLDFLHRAKRPSKYCLWKKVSVSGKDGSSFITDT